MTARKPRSRKDTSYKTLMAQLDAKAQAMAEQRERIAAKAFDAWKERKENGQ
jgi:hypothetical protein